MTGVVLPFVPPVPAAPPEPHAFDRTRFRAQTEMAIQALLDMAQAAIAVLDRLDGDPDYEPDFDDEDDGTAEPVMSALVTLSQIRWVGFDGDKA